MSLYPKIQSFIVKWLMTEQWFCLKGHVFPLSSNVARLHPPLPVLPVCVCVWGGETLLEDMGEGTRSDYPMPATLPHPTHSVLADRKPASLGPVSEPL